MTSEPLSVEDRLLIAPVLDALGTDPLCDELGLVPAWAFAWDDGLRRASATAIAARNTFLGDRSIINHQRLSYAVEQLCEAAVSYRQKETECPRQTAEPGPTTAGSPHPDTYDEN
jgi:hypothetical protein